MAQLDRLVIGDEEYVSYFEAVRTVERLNAEIATLTREKHRMREALETISRVTFSGSEMGEDYQRGNRDAHTNCRQLARLVLIHT